MMPALTAYSWTRIVPQRAPDPGCAAICEHGLRRTSHTHESWAVGDWERSGHQTEVQKSGRNVPEQSAVDAAVAQCAPGEHKHDLNFHAAACVHVKLTECSVFT